MGLPEHQVLNHLFACPIIQRRLEIQRVAARVWLLRLEYAIYYTERFPTPSTPMKLQLNDLS